MALVTTVTTKQELLKPEIRFTSVAFQELEFSISTDTLQNVDIDLPINNSVITAATMRIGQETIKRKTTDIKEIVEDDSVGVKRIGRVTVLGDATSIHGIKDFKQGHNVKELNDTTCSLLPHVTINSPEVVDASGRVVNIYEYSTFGQLYSYYFNVISDGIDRKNHPFYDYPGRLDPVEYVRRGSYYRGYPIINNLIEDYLHYIEPDSIIHDGGIDVFEVRSQRANTMSADIQTKGIRASICSGPWDLPAGTTTELRKGTSMLSDKIELKEYEYDFFEDCQDLVFGDKKFSNSKLGVDRISDSGYKYSLDGYISEGSYMMPPFKDVTAKIISYETITRNASNDLLVQAINNSESLRDISDIGRRFKSSANGVILRPKYEVITQTNLGTDSIAFAGYLRE